MEGKEQGPRKQCKGGPMAVHSLASRACTIATPYSSQPAPRGPRSRRTPAGGPVAVRRSACPSSSELLSLLLCCPSSALRASARCASGHVACSSSRTPDPPRRVQRPVQLRLYGAARPTGREPSLRPRGWAWRALRCCPQFGGVSPSRWGRLLPATVLSGMYGGCARALGGCNREPSETNDI